MGQINKRLNRTRSYNSDIHEAYSKVSKLSNNQKLWETFGGRNVQFKVMFFLRDKSFPYEAVLKSLFQRMNQK